MEFNFFGGTPWVYQQELDIISGVASDFDDQQPIFQDFMTLHIRHPGS